jgi:hypothetical protein
MKTQIDIRLERDPRYVAAKTRYTELQHELNALEIQLSDTLTNLNSINSVVHDRIAEEAKALLSGGQYAAKSSRDLLTKTLSELNHKIRVLREAVSMQKNIVSELAADVGKQIATALLPEHKANVSAVIVAVLKLAEALEDESALYQALFDSCVPTCGVLRPMPFTGVGLLRDSQSRITRYLLECEEYGFVRAADLPDVVRAQIPPKAKPVPVQAARGANADGWLHA